MAGGSRQQQGLKPRNCVICKDEFQPYRDFHVACGKRSCRTAARGKNPRLVRQALECKYCAKFFEADWSGIGKKPPCPDCAAKRARESQNRKNAARNKRYAEDPDRRLANAESLLQRQYGVTLEWLMAKTAEQNNCCAICGRPPDPNGVKAAGRLHVDHDHETGKVRDLLDNHCNRLLGAAQDDPDLLRRAAEYIERHRYDARANGIGQASA